MDDIESAALDGLYGLLYICQQLNAALSSLYSTSEASILKYRIDAAMASNSISLDYEYVRADYADKCLKFISPWVDKTTQRLIELENGFNELVKDKDPLLMVAVGDSVLTEIDDVIGARTINDFEMIDEITNDVYKTKNKQYIKYINEVKQFISALLVFFHQAYSISIGHLLNHYNLSNEVH